YCRSAPLPPLVPLPPPPPPPSPLFPYTTLFRSIVGRGRLGLRARPAGALAQELEKTLLRHRWRDQHALAEIAAHDHQRLQVGLRSEEHTSELQSPCNLVCRLLLEKKNKRKLLML